MALWLRCSGPFKLKHDIARLPSIKQLANMLIFENYALSSGFTDVVTAFLLCLSVRVTVASAESSFSKLKLIKNYLRSAMGHERLCRLALLSIEESRAKSIVVDQVIQHSTEMKAQKVTVLIDSLLVYCLAVFAFFQVGNWHL